MREFQILVGDKDKNLATTLAKKEKLIELYKKNFSYHFSCSDDKAKICFWGVKWFSKINLKGCEYVDIKHYLALFNILITYFQQLTYKQLMVLFPIEKIYDGEKFQSKDYFSTMEYLKDKDLNVCIGEDVYDLLWNYYNYTLMNFSIKEMLLIDALNRYECKASLFEQFIEDNGLKIDTYTYNKENDYMVNNRTGQVYKVHKPKARVPKNFKIINGKQD